MKVRNSCNLEHAKKILSQQLLPHFAKNADLLLILEQSRSEIDKGFQSQNTEALTQLITLIQKVATMTHADNSSEEEKSNLSPEEVIKHNIAPLVQTPQTPTKPNTLTNEAKPTSESKLPLWNLERLRQAATAFIPGQGSPTTTEDESNGLNKGTRPPQLPK